MSNTPDRIEKLVNLDAPQSRVWKALTDVKQFNQWFGVSLNGAFTPGAAVSGSLTSPKYSHLTFTLWVESVEPERLFSFRWHPYAMDEGVEYSQEPTTLVTFLLEQSGSGTQLKITESGFDAIPESRRAKAFSANSGGWDAQAKNIQKFVESNAQGSLE